MMGTLRDKIIPLADDQREQQMESQVWNSVYGQPLGSNGGQPTVQNPPSQAPVKKSQTLYEMISSYGKPYDYTQEIKDAERNRKIGIFTDLAGLAGNLISGRRKFGNVPLASTQANTNLQRLKDLQRQGEINYQNTLRSTRMQQYMLDKQDAIRGEENARRDKQYNDQLSYRNNQLQRQQYRDTVSDQRYKEQRKEAKQARVFSEGMQTKNYERALRNDKETREYKNLMLAAKTGTNGIQTPKGMIDYYNPSTNTFYRVEEKRMNSFLPQIYSAIEKDAENNPELKKSLVMMYNSNPSERREFVKQYWASSPSAVKLMENIKGMSFKGKYGEQDDVIEYTPPPAQNDTVDFTPPSSENKKEVISNAPNMPKEQSLSRGMFSSFEDYLTFLEEEKRKRMAKADDSISRASASLNKPYYQYPESVKK